MALPKLVRTQPAYTVAVATVTASLSGCKAQRMVKPYIYTSSVAAVVTARASTDCMLQW
jgi:hypothetical protein